MEDSTSAAVRHEGDTVNGTDALNTGLNSPDVPNGDNGDNGGGVRDLTQCLMERVGIF